MKSFAIFILTHGDLAFSLKNTVENIIGKQPPIFPYTNKIDTLPLLFEKINNHLHELNTKNLYLFVDLVGGSCWSLANMLKKENPGLVVLGGVNIPMIVSFLINYENLDQTNLIIKIMEDAKKGIALLGNIKQV